MVIDLTEEQIDETTATALSPKSRKSLQDELYARQIQNELWSTLQPNINECSSSSSSSSGARSRHVMSTHKVDDILARRDTQILRFNSSDIAAIAGYHEYKHPVDLFEDYLYQDLLELFHLDCTNLGLTIISEQEETEQVMKKLRTSKPELHMNLTMKKNDLKKPEILKSGSKVCDLTNDVSKILSCSMDVLSTKEIRLLSDAVSGNSKKEYGILNESSALDLYEQMTGYEVKERNRSLLIWPLHSVRAEEIACPPSLAKSYFKYSYHPKKLKRVESSCVAAEQSCKADVTETQSTISCFEVIHVDNESDDMKESDDTNGMINKQEERGNKGDNNNNNPRSNQAALDGEIIGSRSSMNFPLFYIVGKVDGVSDQVDTRNDDPSTWLPIKVVIEMKNRVKHQLSEKTTVKLYEQIQIVTYMMMLGLSCGDLVSAITERQEEELIPYSQIDEGKQYRNGDYADMKENNNDKHSIRHPCSLQKRCTSNRRKVQVKVICDICQGEGLCTLFCETCNWDICESCLSNESETLGDAIEKANKTNTNVNDNVNNNNHVNDVYVKRKTTKLILHREYVDCEPHFHRSNWLQQVFPNIVNFFNAIMKVRLDDNMRYQWLQGTEEDKVQMLKTICPTLLNRWCGR